LRQYALTRVEPGQPAFGENERCGPSGIHAA
jgi:hypothetical protein